MAAFRAASFFALAPLTVLLVFDAFVDFADLAALVDFADFVFEDLDPLAAFLVFVLFVLFCGLLVFAFVVCFALFVAVAATLGCSTSLFSSGGVPGISLPSPGGSLWASAS